MSFKKKLQVYLDTWVAKWIIQEEQKQRILDDIAHETKASMFFSLLSIIGALFIGIWALLVIASNRQYFPKFMKLLFILAMPIVSIGVGYYLSYIKQEYKKIWYAFIFLWSLLIWASLALLWQLYHLGGSVSFLLFLWFILTIPLVSIFKFRSIALLNVILLYLAIFSSFEDNLFTNQKTLLITIALVAVFITSLATFIQKNLQHSIFKKYVSLFNVYKITSITVLLYVLFLWIFYPWLVTTFFHHIIFLIVLFFAMREAIRIHSTALKYITFLFLGIFIIVKYVSWFWSYLHTGIFFIWLWILLLLLVYGYIKLSKYFLELFQIPTLKEWKKDNEYHNSETHNV